MPPACVGTRIIKTLSVAQPGAIKLLRRYGKALVCVRYRCSADGLTRYTTVELLVDEAPIQKRRQEFEVVAIRLGKMDMASTRKDISAHGGQWDRTAKVWRLTRSAATLLGLLGCVVGK